MNSYQIFRLILVLSVTVFLASCQKYDDDIINGSVQIEILEAPDNKSIILSNENVHNIKVKFSTQTTLDSLSVSLFVEDKSKFRISGNSTVELKDNFVLQSIKDDKNILDFQISGLNAAEYIFEETINLSNYPATTCFVLAGSALGVGESSAGGTEHKMIYFCKSTK